MLVCGSCGNENPPHARFCNECGASLPQVAGDLAEGYERLTAEVTDRLAPRVRGEHRLVTCVFADLAGSVERTRELAPEAATQLVNSLLEAMVEVLVRYGGTIDRFLGDGVLAVFGVPQTHEDDPERAVRAALDIVAHTGRLELEVTIGVNTGRVYFGPVGSSLHEELTVMGPVVNLAARLQGKARAGQVLIGESTYEHVKRAFATTELTLDIKGLDGAVVAYRAERLLDQPEKVRGIRGLESRMIGRDEELSKLNALLGEPGVKVASVTAEAGVGKSRLASEFRKRVASQGGTWLEGRCTELNQEVAYGPLRDLLTRDGATSEVVERLAVSTQLDAAWREEVAPFLMALVSEPDRRVTDAADNERRALTLEAVRGYLRARGSDGLLVVAFDDLHWTDPLTLELLPKLIKQPWEESIVFLFLSRPDPRIGRRVQHDGGTSPVDISLHELSDSEARVMINSLLRIDALPPELEAAIVARAEGNPFFVEEIVRSFIQQGVVVREGDVWRATSELADVDIPESVQAIVASRLDRLGDESRLIAQHASVLNTTFSVDLLEAMTGVEVAPGLGTLVDAGLLYPEAGEEAREFSFWHALTREGVYETLLPSQRLELHERAGQAYEAIAPERVEQLAYQFEHTDDHHKAVHYLTLAARQSMDSYLNDAALGYGDRAMARVEELGADASVGARAQLHGVRGELLERLARHEEAQAELRSALEIGLLDPLDEVRLMTVLGRSLRLGGQFELAHEAYDGAVEILEGSPLGEAPEYQHAAIDVGQERGVALYFSGRNEDLIQHNAKLGRRVDVHGSASHKIDQAGAEALAQYQQSRFLVSAETVALVETTLGYARETGNAGRLAGANFGLGFALLWADRPDEATDYLAEGVRLAQRIGDATLLMRATSYHAISLRRVGLIEEAETAAQRALQTAQAGDHRYYRGHALATVAWVAWARGELDDALAMVGAAYDAWGREVLRPDEQEGLPPGLEPVGSEFAWMAVWPAVAVESARSRVEAAIGHLRLLLSPWERRMHQELRSTVEAALADPAPASIAQAVDRAKHDRLL